jgi:hypothetical protein
MLHQKVFSYSLKLAANARITYIFILYKTNTKVECYVKEFTNEIPF